MKHETPFIVFIGVAGIVAATAAAFIVVIAAIFQFHCHKAVASFRILSTVWFLLCMRVRVTHIHTQRHTYTPVFMFTLLHRHVKLKMSSHVYVYDSAVLLNRFANFAYFLHKNNARIKNNLHQTVRMQKNIERTRTRKHTTKNDHYSITRILFIIEYVPYNNNLYIMYEYMFIIKCSPILLNAIGGITGA